MSHIKPSDGDNTTTSVTYVANGKPKINKQQDEFDRKYVTSRKIPQNTDSDSGGGGSHVSSSGVSHGGGGSRR